MKYLVVMSKIIFLCVICNAEANWYNTNWQYRDQQNATGVWNSNFKGVWHLKETSGGSGAIKGLTSNGHNSADTNSPNLWATGQIGNAISFDSTNTGDVTQLRLGAGAELPPAQQMWTSLRVRIRSPAKRMRITLKEAEIAKSQLVTDDEVWS